MDTHKVEERLKNGKLKDKNAAANIDLAMCGRLTYLTEY
jgi:hypothetical protein